MASVYFFNFSEGIPSGHPILHPIICGGKGRRMKPKIQRKQSFLI
jgi:hypothetical protein